MKALMDVCDIIAKVKGKPRMKLLEQEMKMEWEKGVCSPSVCTCACVECVIVYMLHVNTCMSACDVYKVWLSPTAECAEKC